MQEITHAIIENSIKETFSKSFRLKFTQQAQDIISKMSLEEKVSLMGGKTNIEDMVGFDMSSGHHYNYFPFPASGSEKFQVPEILFCDGPRGVVCGVEKSTCFPVSMARGATFDVDLEERIGVAIAREILAYKGNFFGGVCINLPYHPGWGRSQETYGEESFHIGQMGSASVRGVQSQGVIACIKHYAFNSMEISRYKVSVETAKRTEREVYLPHFKECIDAGAASLMTSYNQYQGVYCGHHDYLINQVLKNEWDFDGFVISDFGSGIRDTVAAANGGMDIEMCDTKLFGARLVEAVKEGLVKEDVIDRAALHIVRTMLALQAYGKNNQVDESVIGCKEHIDLALEAAEKSITLLKNDHNTLPLSKETTKKLAVIGKLADQENTGDHGSSHVYPAYVVTPFDGIANLNYCEVVYNDGNDIEFAAQLAKTVDAVVFVVGYDHSVEGEYVPIENLDSSLPGENQLTDVEDTSTKTIRSVGGDRKNSLSLSDHDIELIKSVSMNNPKSVVVLIGGNMIMMEEWKDFVPSILMAYYPGMEGGTAIAKILFGDVNPSGKLPFVVVKNEKDLPEVNWDTDSQFYEYYHGYVKLEKEGIEPALPYGFGLSYTQYQYSNPAFDFDGEIITARCEVENIGPMDGEEVVQFYVGFENFKVDLPHKLLRGFKRIFLEAGKKKQVEIKCPLEKLGWYNENTHRWQIEKIKYSFYIGSDSSDEHLLKGSLDLSNC